MQREKMSAREVALRAITAVRRKNAWADLALGGLIDRYELSLRDAALASRIANGVMQNMMLCDFYISHFSSICISKLEPVIHDILRLSVYQLVFLDKIPPSAAVNEGVALARKTSNPRAAGFVNAILRKIALSVERSNLPVVTGEMLQRLSVQYSHPIWLVKKFCNILDSDSVEKLLAANNDPDIPTTAQVNTLLTDSNNVLHLLHAAGVDAVRHEWLDDCIELHGAGNITRLDAFQNGLIYIQDTAARLAVMAAEPKPGDIVIDGCAAPGGKSFTAAITMKNEGKVIAYDINQDKLRHIQEGAKRLGITILVVKANDALNPESLLVNKADIVLADVPCSGFGVIRKKPDIRYKPYQDIANLPDIQHQILSSLSLYVKPGGVLLYSTCTVLESENEGVIDQFLLENRTFSAEGFSLPGIGHVNRGMVTLWPHINGTDGFFICKLRRR